MLKKLLAVLGAMLLLCGTAAVAQEEGTVYTGNNLSYMDYTCLLLWEEGSEAPSEVLIEDIKTLFFDSYIPMYEIYGTSDRKLVEIYLCDWEEADAPVSRRYSDRDGIFISRSFLEQKKENLNHLVELLFAEVQSGCPNPYDDPLISALELGLQAYARSRFGYVPETEWGLIPYEEGQSLTDGGQVAGAFIEWVVSYYGDMIPVRLNRVLHEGGTEAELVLYTATGHTVSQLWEQYVADASAE